MPTPLAADLDALAETDVRAVEIWLTKLESFLKDHSIEQARELFAKKQVTPVAASYQGGLLLSHGEARKAHFDHFRYRLDICEALGIPIMVVVADFVQKPDAESLERAVISLKQAGQWAAGSKVKLALEFRAGHSFCTSLDTAVQLISLCGEPNVGICLDAFHYATGPSKSEDLELLTPQNLTFVQLCDVAGVPRELATDSDRVMPGEGDFRLDRIVDHLLAIDYQGWVSLELFNPILWSVKPTQVVELGMKAMRRLFPE